MFLDIQPAADTSKYNILDHSNKEIGNLSHKRLELRSSNAQIVRSYDPLLNS